MFLDFFYSFLKRAPNSNSCISRNMVHGWTSSLISKIWLFARSGISTMRILKQDFNFQKHIFGKLRFTQWTLKQFLFEEIRRIDLLWKIVKYRASLLWIFNVYEFCCFLIIYCVKQCSAVFLFNEAVLKFPKLPCY